MEKNERELNNGKREVREHETVHFKEIIIMG